LSSPLVAGGPASLTQPALSISGVRAQRLEVRLSDSF
jgi:hypothetical protein